MSDVDGREVLDAVVGQVNLTEYGVSGASSRSRTLPWMSSASGWASGLSLPWMSSDAVAPTRPRSSRSASCGEPAGETLENALSLPLSWLRSAE